MPSLTLTAKNITPFHLLGEGVKSAIVPFTKQIKRLHWRLSMIKSVNLHNITNRYRVLEQCADVFHAAHNRSEQAVVRLFVAIYIYKEKRN